MIRKFLQLSLRGKLYFFIAWFLLIGARLAIWWLPFRVYSKAFGPVLKDPQSFDQTSRPLPRDLFLIKSSISKASKAVPITCVCLDQAVAAQLMLRWKKIPAQVTLGLRREEKSKELKAHAWVQYGNALVVGGRQSRGFSSLVTFGHR